MKLKICGIKKKQELLMLDSLRVDYAGLWWNIPGGKFNLMNNELESLLSVKTEYIKRVIVTFEHDISKISHVVCSKNVHGIQLHGFQLPKQIKSIKSKCPDIPILKVLHIKENKCLEESMLNRYLDSGVDYIILDNYISQVQIGSTGRKINMAYLKEVVKKISDIRLENCM